MLSLDMSLNTQKGNTLFGKAQQAKNITHS